MRVRGCGLFPDRTADPGALLGDEQLIQAYREARDIHRMTASQVFHTPFDEVTDLQRRNAKAVNFGIVDGISSFGLSQDLSITRKGSTVYRALL